MHEHRHDPFDGAAIGVHQQLRFGGIGAVAPAQLPALPGPAGGGAAGPTPEQVAQTEAAIDQFDLAPGDGVFAEEAGVRPPAFSSRHDLSSDGVPESQRSEAFTQAREGIVDLVSDGTSRQELTDYVTGHFQSSVPWSGGLGAEEPAQQGLIAELARIYLGE